MDTFIFAWNAIFPIIFLIFLGYFLKEKKFLDEAWFKKGNTFIFKICLPCLLFVNVYSIASFQVIDWSVVLYAVAAILIVFFLWLLVVKMTIPDKRQKGPILQCAFRSNFAIVGLPLAESLGGAEGVGIAAILSAFSIPVFNILAVIALTMYTGEQGQKINWRDTLKKITKNPLIIGVACGFVALGIRQILPVQADGTPIFTLKKDVAFLFDAISDLAKISSPLALIILGGLFDFSAVKALKKQIVIGTVSRVAIVPFLAIGSAILLSKYTSFLTFDVSVYPALIALFGSPVAVSSAIMAQEMDNDGVLAGQLVVWTSIASIFTLFLMIVMMRSMGLLQAA